MGRVPRAGSIPAWTENISPPQPAPAASCYRGDGDQFGQSQVCPPHCPLSASPCELRPHLGDTEGELVPLGPVDGSEDRAGGSRLSRTVEKRNQSWSPCWESWAGLCPPAPLSIPPSMISLSSCLSTELENWETAVNKSCVFKLFCTVQENALVELQLFNQIHVTMSLKVLAKSREKKKSSTQLEEHDIKTSCLLTPTTVNSF